MSAQAGHYSASEATRIAFLQKRDPVAASDAIAQLFCVYLKAVETVREFPAQRACRGAFVDSLLELAVVLGPKTAGLIERVIGARVEAPLAYLETLRTHPGDRAAKAVIVSTEGPVSPGLLTKLEALKVEYGFEFRTR